MTRPLRIFLCCQQDLRPHSVPAYRFWIEYFRAALAEVGHSCLEAPGCDWAEGLEAQPETSLRIWRDAVWERAVNWMRREHAKRPIDLFLSYLYPVQVHAGCVAEIRALGIPCVNFFCDNVRLFRRAPGEYAGFDLNWVPELGAAHLYKEAGLPFLNVPMPCWIAPEWRTPSESESLPPTFVGTRDEQRAHLFAAAYRLGLTLDLRGTGWSGNAAPAPQPARGSGRQLWANQTDFARQHGLRALLRKVQGTIFPRAAESFDFGPHVRPAPEGEDYWRILRESKVMVGVNRFPSLRHPFAKPGCYSRLRDLEATMAGACLLTEWAEGLDSLFEPGIEIEVYRNEAELTDQMRRLLADPAKRTRLKRAGQRRSLADHTIAKTLEAIVNRIGISRRTSETGG